MGGAWNTSGTGQDSSGRSGPGGRQRESARYATGVARGLWFAWRGDGSRTTAITASSHEGLISAMAVDRRYWLEGRTPPSTPAAA